MANVTNHYFHPSNNTFRSTKERLSWMETHIKLLVAIFVIPFLDQVVQNKYINLEYLPIHSNVNLFNKKEEKIEYKSVV